MAHSQEVNLIVSDSKGNPVAMWRKHPKLKINILYRLKEMSLTDIEKLGTDLYEINRVDRQIPDTSNEESNVIVQP